jgi:hypothetical protein
MLDEPGRAGWPRNGTHEGLGLTTDNLRFRTREGHDWPGGVLRIGHAVPRGERPASAVLRAERIDLGALGAVAASLPLGAPAHGWLDSLQPQGQVTDLDATWQADHPEAPLEAFGEGRFRARGVVQALSLRGAPSGRMSSTGSTPCPGGLVWPGPGSTSNSIRTGAAPRCWSPTGMSSCPTSSRTR